MSGKLEGGSPQRTTEFVATISWDEDVTGADVSMIQRTLAEDYGVRMACDNSELMVFRDD